MSKLLCIVVGGDSIAAGDDGWFYQSLGVTGRQGSTISGNSAQTYFATNILGKNCAIAGTRLNTNGFPDLVPLAPGWIDPVVSYKTEIGSGPTRKYLFVNCIGSNDSAVAGYGDVNLYAAAVASACADRKTAGFDIVAMQTLLPRNDVLGNETNRATYNALLRDSSWRAAHGIDYVLDLASETTMGNPATCSNTTYYVDGVHPTTAGHALLAPIAASLFSTVLATF